MQRRHPILPPWTRATDPRARHRSILGAVTAIVGVAILVTPASADVAAHPAYIQTGSCADAGDVVAPVADLVEEHELPAVGSIELATHPVRSSLTGAVPLAYGDLFATAHSVVVLQAPSIEGGSQPVILCGNLSGYPLEATDVAVGLGEVDGSGFSGIATLHDNGDVSVDVAVYMTTRDPWVGDVD